MADLGLNILINGRDNGAGAAIKGVGSALQAVVSGNIVGAAAGLGAAVLGVGIASTVMAGKYDQSMRSVQANTGASTKDMQQYDAGLKKLAVDAGVGPQKLTDALYATLSAGQKGKAALDVVTLATEDAKIGMTDAATTGLALNKMLYGFSVPASQFNRVNGEMLRTVTLGSMTMKDYAGAVSKSIPVAIQYKDSMESMNAVIATISPVTKSAAVASTDYNNLLKVMDGNTDSVIKKATGLNASFDGTAFKSMDLEHKVAYLNDTIIKHGHNISEVIGKQQNAAQAFTILSTHVGAYTGNLKDLSDQQANAQKTQDAWNITQGGFNQTLDRVKASLDVLMINIGNVFLPILTQAGQALLPMISGFTQLVTHGNPVSQLFLGMRNNWLDFADSINMGGIVSAFNGFKQIVTSSLGSIGNLIGPLLNNVNNTVISIAGSFSGVLAPAIRIGSQIFAGLAGIIKTVMLSVETNLLPAIQHLASVVGPLVAKIVDWISKSNILPTVFNVLKVAINDAIVVISKIIDAIANMITFFTQNAVGIAIFKAVLITLGIALTAIALVVIPMIIIALVNMGIAAVATGIEMAIAFAPIILPILAVIAIITLVMLAVTHWGQIAHWLQGVWAAFSSWFMSAMGAVGNFFKGIWEGIVNWFKGAWSGIVGFFTGVFNGIKNGIATALNAVKTTISSIVTGTINWLKNAWQTAVNAVVNSFQWLYNHNYYFKDLVDGIKAAITIGIAWLKNAWQAAVNFVTSIWQGWVFMAKLVWSNVVKAFHAVIDPAVAWLKQLWTDEVNGLKIIWNDLVNIATTVWNNVVAAFHAVIDPVIAWLSSIWNTSVTGLGTLWNTLSGLAQTAWNAVTSVFQNAWNGISGALNSLWSNISGFMSNLAGQMASFGSNMIQGFINGINSMLGAVGNAAGNVANKIKSFLGFHSPAKEGPGTELMQWPVNMVKSYADVLSAQTPVMAAAVANVAQAFYGLHHEATRKHTTHHTGTHHTTTHKHKPITNVAPTSVTGTGMGLLNTFNKDLSTNTAKAHGQAESILSTLMKTMHQQSEQVLKLHLEGNKIQEKQIRDKLLMEGKQFQLYKDMIKDHGLKFDSTNANDPINFAYHKHVKKPKGLGAVKAPGASGVSTSSGGYGSGGTTYMTINNEFHFAVTIPKGTTQQEARQIADMVEKELNTRFRRQGSYTTTSSGGSGS